jgi:hypothetical protein
LPCRYFYTPLATHSILTNIFVTSGYKILLKMARITPLSSETAPSIVLAEFERHCIRFKTRITNMKGILGYSLTAFEVYMQWYVVYDDMRIILGQRLVNLYAYSISRASQCLLWTTYFRKCIIDAGENPDKLKLTERDRLVMEFGKAIGSNHGKTDQALFDKLSRLFNARKMVDIISFAGQMIAACIFANATETDLDFYLEGYEP